MEIYTTLLVNEGARPFMQETRLLRLGIHKLALPHALSDILQIILQLRSLGNEMFSWVRHLLSNIRDRARARTWRRMESRRRWVGNGGLEWDTNGFPFSFSRCFLDLNLRSGIHSPLLCALPPPPTPRREHKSLHESRNGDLV